MGKAVMLCVVLVFLLAQPASGSDPASTLKLPPQRSNASNLIAFSAKLSADKELLGDTTIVYDQVSANVGERYFPTSGQFACADDGLYVFMWSFRRRSPSGTEGSRCINKLRQGVTDHKFGPKDSYNPENSNTGVAEMTGVLQCTTSPLTAVTVMTVPWSEDIGSTAIYDARFTKFSGFKLSEDVAFTVELSQEQALSPGSRIRFDRVVANYGQHYDPINHFFRCPDAGVYVLSVVTYTRDPATPWSVSRLMMDSDTILQGPITYRATQEHDSGSASATAVLQCAPGASIYVEAQPAHHFPYNSYGAALTSFTGFKLYDDEPGAVAFTAVRTTNLTIQNENQPFVFDRIVTNIGNAFDGVHSEFVCPDNDYYLFTWSNVADFRGQSLAYVDLYMDDERVQLNFITQQSGGDESGTTGSSSISAIRQCSEGSRLYVVGRHASNRVYLGGYNSFTGYKIPGY